MSKSENVIIVVDDDKAVRDSLKFSLQLDGMDVACRIFCTSVSETTA